MNITNNKGGDHSVSRQTQTLGDAYRWGMLTWFNQLLLDQGDNRGGIQADAAENRR